MYFLNDILLALISGGVVSVLFADIEVSDQSEIIMIVISINRNKAYFGIDFIILFVAIVVIYKGKILRKTYF